ncbi:hypothetical protein evm_013166 [Chilo suppressalis]|nr:hypothetical protein evm_013166 [Chilo suppressalis]
MATIKLLFGLWNARMPQITMKLHAPQPQSNKFYGGPSLDKSLSLSCLIRNEKDRLMSCFKIANTNSQNKFTFYCEFRGESEFVLTEQNSVRTSLLFTADPEVKVSLFSENYTAASDKGYFTTGILHGAESQSTGFVTIVVNRPM